MRPLNSLAIVIILFAARKAERKYKISIAIWELITKPKMTFESRTILMIRSLFTMKLSNCMMMPVVIQIQKKAISFNPSMKASSGSSSSCGLSEKRFLIVLAIEKIVK